MVKRSVHTAKPQDKTALSLVRQVLVTLRRFPLFYKVLIANSFLIVVGTLIGTWLVTVSASQISSEMLRIELLGGLGLSSLGITVLVNYLILRGALQPIGTLRRLAVELEAGKTTARASPPFFTDRDTEKLISAINKTLDQLQRYQEQVRFLSQRGTRALELERMRISRELHDETSQVLTALLIMGRVLINKLAFPENRQAVEELMNTTRQLLQDIQRICVGLRPPVLDDMGLLGALRWYVEAFLPKDSLQVHLELDKNLGRLPTEVELAVYRIAQEALTNVVRHAKASQVWLSLVVKEDRLFLTVKDDGVGFQPESLDFAASAENIGLFGMRERAALVGGELTIHSASGQGTTVQAAIPLGT